MKEIKFTKTAWNDFIGWAETDKKVFTKLTSMINDTCRNPFGGNGNPEPLKYQLSGYWSRKINNEHRLIYKVSEDCIEIISCRYHYEKN
jgi:toxin YoeB